MGNDKLAELKQEMSKLIDCMCTTKPGSFESRACMARLLAMPAEIQAAAEQLHGAELEAFRLDWDRAQEQMADIQQPHHLKPTTPGS